MIVTLTFEMYKGFLFYSNKKMVCPLVMVDILKMTSVQTSDDSKRQLLSAF